MYLNTHVTKLLFVMLFYLFSCTADKKDNASLKTNPSWPVTSYNFGRLDELTISSQIDLLHSSGYKGIILKSVTKEDFQNLDQYIEAVERIEDFKIDAVFERYNFNDTAERKERWKKVIDKVAEKEIQLWVIFGKKMEGITDDFIENKIREIVAYATPKNVEVILYPHSDCYIESAEEALPFVEKINHPNLKLAFHLYHDIRAGNGSRINEVFENIKHRLGAVTLAGTDSVADHSSPYARNISTIKPLDQGNYNLNNFVEILVKSGYQGSVGFMNFSIEENPKDYLPRSMKIWERLN